ncbi:SDR family NAD(P)-dependent oxidoreductase [Gryllotalpicola reticulitermitis]|uniref:SDR family NAD(P)-dependent oxidoreductase n=1 Tax=Gryllotalpicola reticulitermitis TaxID=1184153 RepID=A0ABV8Q9H6_9MICO
MAATRLISTPFTASSTTDEVVEAVDLTGVRTIVTGASSGLGVETARALTAAGAEVFMAVRNPVVGAEIASRIAAQTGRPEPHVRPLDLVDRGSIARFVAAWNGPLHLLINNAGVVTGGLERATDGWELQFATNHLGHFALADGLHSALRDGAAERGGARVVVLSSTAHMRSGVDFDDVHFLFRDYDPQIAYAQSKTANSLFAVEATRRWAREGIFANTVNPGGVATGLQRNFTPEQKASLDAAEAAGVFAYKSVEQGAATTLIAAVRPEFAHTGGHYLDDGQEAYTVSNDASLGDHPHGVKEWALDPALAERLWRVSTGLIAS